MPRDSRIVANPIFGLPSASALLSRLTSSESRALATTLEELRADCRERAEESWRRNKGPIAAYWKACGVYAGHIAKVLKKTVRETDQAEARLRKARDDYFGGKIDLGDLLDEVSGYVDAL